MARAVAARAVPVAARAVAARAVAVAARAVAVAARAVAARVVAEYRYFNPSTLFEQQLYTCHMCMHMCMCMQMHMSCVMHMHMDMMYSHISTVSYIKSPHRTLIVVNRFRPKASARRVGSRTTS